MRRIICVSVVLLLTVLAVGMPSTAWGAERQSARQAQLDRPVRVDQTQERSVQHSGLLFGIGHFRLLINSSPAFGIQVTLLQIEETTTPAQVQTPTGIFVGYRESPDLDEDPWGDTK